MSLFKNKGFKIAIFAFLFFGLFFGTFVFRGDLKDYFVNNFGTFQVSGANFDLGIKKIPYNTKTIDFTFNKEIDAKSINSKSVLIIPQTDGEVFLKDKNTLSFKLTGNLKKDFDYTFIISKDIKTTSSQNLGEDMLYIVKTVGEFRVSKFIPEEKLENLSKNIAVFFSAPVVNLSSIKEKEFICPLQITPKVEGKCVWTTSGVLEFIPTKGFAGATKYDVEITSSGMNFPLAQNYKTSFTTPDLTAVTSKDFIPKNYINLDFNFPVDILELKKFLTLSQDINGESKNIELKIEKIKNSETSFLIKPVSGEFFYDVNYKLLVKKGVSPKYGNTPLKEDLNFIIHSQSLLNNSTVYKNEYSQSGELINNYEFSFPKLPLKDIFFQLQFNEEMPLNKELFSFTSTGKTIDFDLSYVKTIDYSNSQSGETVDDKTKIKFTPKETLLNDTDYKLQILKKSNPYLLKDIVYDYKTAPKLKITDFIFLDYLKSCLYTNNPLDGSFSGMSFSNSGMIKSQESFGGLSCPSAKKGEYLQDINSRLNPNSTYEFYAEKINDTYGNKLEENFKKEVKTGDFKSSDIYVYTGFPNITNVFPKDLPLVVNIQTINTKKVIAQVCELSQDEYLKYISSTGEFSECKNKTEKELNTKNVYWKLQNNKFDIENDILGRKTNSNILLLKFYPENNNKEKETSNIISITNLNLFLEKAENKSIIFATDIKNHKTISNLELSFYDYNGKKVNIPYTFNSEKKAYEISQDITSISTIIAKNNDYFSLITQNDDFGNYDFKYISGQQAYDKQYMYIYTDRPIYKPDDEIFVKGILRHFNFDGYKKSKIKSGTLEIRDENYQLYRNLNIKIDENGNFTTSFRIPKETQLGRFQFTYFNSPEGQNFYTSGEFYIEQYKKPTFKIDASQTKNDFVLGEKIDFTINPKYYFGGKLVGTDGISSILTQNYFFDPKEYSDYQFGVGSQYFDCVYWGYCDYGDNLESGVKNFKINENGEYKYSYDFGNQEDKSEKIYNFNFTITDPDTKKTVSKSISKTLHTTDSYVGLKTNYFNDKKSGINIDIVSLDFDSKIVTYKPVNIEIIKRDWTQVKKLGVDGIFYNDYSLEEQKEASFKLITDTKGLANNNYKPKKSGEYEIKASYTGENGKTFVSSNIVYVSGEEYISWRNDNNTVTELTSEKNLYKLGEKAQFMLKSPVNNGKYIVFLEKDDGIIDYFVSDINNYSQKFSINISDKHYPNVYLKAFLIGSQKGNPLPVYKRALGMVKVLTDYKNLNISISTNKKNYNPGEKVEINIQVLDKNGKVVPNANGSLSVVDESVLALKGNPIKNPYSFFYEMKRYLGVVSYSSLKYLVEKLEVKDTTGGEKGGAGDQVKGGNSKKSRGVFKDTALWIGNFSTDKNGRTKIVLDSLPDNLTTWVIEALINTHDSKFGVGYENITTSKEVMIEDNLPRFFSTDDKITLSPVIYNRTGKDSNFRVEISGENISFSNKKQDILIKSGESQTVNFEASVPNISKINSYSKITIQATSTVNNSKSDSIEKIIPIYISQTQESVSTIGKTDKISYDENISLKNIDKQFGSLTLNYSATLFSYLLDGIDYLNNYPYGCIEQKTSAVMPNVYIKKLYDASGKPFDLKQKFIDKYIDGKGIVKISVDDAIKDYLIEIKKFQNIDGGMMYWYDTENKVSNYKLSAYVLSSLSEIKSLGYKIDEKFISNLVSYIKTDFYNKEICRADLINNCLTKEEKTSGILAIINHNKNDYEAYKMYKLLKEDKSNSLQQAELLSKLSLIESITPEEKQQLKEKSLEIVKYILNNDLVFNPRGAFISSDFEDSRVLKTAKLLEIISKIGLENFENISTITDNMIRFIAISKTNNSFGSSLDNIGVIKSLTTYLQTTKELKNTSLTAKFSLNGQSFSSKKIDNNNIFESYKKDIDLKNLYDQNVLNVAKTGSGNIYYDINLKYFIPSKYSKSIDNGFFIEKTYFDFNEFKKVDLLKKQEYSKYLSGEILYENLKYPKEVVEYLKPIKSGNIGQLVLVYNKIITSEDRDQIFIESFIPSGSEIVNTTLQTEDKRISNLPGNIYFDKEDLKDEKFFGFSYNLPTGIYDFSYVIRLTHSGNFGVKPTFIGEFYHNEVFGRTKGEDFEVE